MRCLITGLSLVAILIFGAAVAGCQPTKPCHCVQNAGCRCPLPPPAKNTPAPQGQPGQTQTNGQPQLVKQNRHSLRHEARHHSHARWREAATGYLHGWHRRREAWLARHREGSSQHENWAADGEERRGELNSHGVRRRHEPPSSRSGGALSFDYHSSSLSYRLGEYAPSPDRVAPREDDEHSFHRFHHRAREHYAERDFGAAPYGPDYERSGPEAEIYGAGAEFRPARMSINSSEALDTWHGYGVDCPDRDGE